MSVQLFDRGLLNRNDVMDIWNLPHVDGGDKFYIRKEYAALEDLGKEFDQNADGKGSGIQVNDAPDGAGTGGAHEEV